MADASLVLPERLSRVVAYFHPRRVVLFGSRARGEAGPDSDIDLLVVLDDDAPPERLTARAGWESRRGYDRPADVIPVRDFVYRRRARIAGTLAYEAEHDGIAVYERIRKARSQTVACDRRNACRRRVVPPHSRNDMNSAAGTRVVAIPFTAASVSA